MYFQICVSKISGSNNLQSLDFFHFRIWRFSASKSTDIGYALEVEGYPGPIGKWMTTGPILLRYRAFSQSSWWFKSSFSCRELRFEFATVCWDVHVPPDGMNVWIIDKISKYSCFFSSFKVRSYFCPERGFVKVLLVFHGFSMGSGGGFESPRATMWLNPWQPTISWRRRERVLPVPWGHWTHWNGSYFQ